MTTLQKKQLLGYSLVKRDNIAPASKALSSEASKPTTAQVKDTAQKVIKTHRDVLIALRDR